MPDAHEAPQRRYSAGHAARELRVDKSTLLRWERRPDFPLQVRRDRDGARWFSVPHEVPDAHEAPQRRYSAGHAARELRVDKSTLLRWERRPDFPLQVRRDRDGARWFSVDDIARITAWHWPDGREQPKYRRSPLQSIKALGS